MYLQPFNLENSIEFNSQSFQKHVILEEEEQKLLLISLEKDQIMPEHFSPVDAGIYVLKGEIIFVIENKEHKVKKGEMFIIPAKTPHKVIGKHNSKFTVTRI